MCIDEPQWTGILWSFKHSNPAIQFISHILILLTSSVQLTTTWSTMPLKEMVFHLRLSPMSETSTVNLTVMSRDRPGTLSHSPSDVVFSKETHGHQSFLSYVSIPLFKNWKLSNNSMAMTLMAWNLSPYHSRTIFVWLHETKLHTRDSLIPSSSIQNPCPWNSNLPNVDPSVSHQVPLPKCSSELMIPFSLQSKANLKSSLVLLSLSMEKHQKHTP